MFNTAIPGQSLTSEPKNYPWENPPEFNEPEDALLWHMERLQEPKRIKSMLGLLEMNLDVVTLTEGLLRGAVADGRHTIDVSLIIAPIIHEYIVGTAEAAGIEFNEGLEEDFDEDQFQYAVEKAKARKILDQMDDTKTEVDLSSLEEPMAETEMPEPEMEQEVQPMGLMARRA